MSKGNKGFIKEQVCANVDTLLALLLLILFIPTCYVAVHYIISVLFMSIVIIASCGIHEYTTSNTLYECVTKLIFGCGFAIIAAILGSGITYLTNKYNYRHKKSDKSPNKIIK
jgi:hypothetical protein